MTNEAIKCTKFPIKSDFHRTMKFINDPLLLQMKTPFWIRSWNYTNPNKPHNCWNNFPLIMYDKEYKMNLNKVPNIAKYLKKTGPYKIAGLSWLPPNCEIPRHKDKIKRNMVKHLILYGNNNSAIIVDNKKINVNKNGHNIIFDDSKNHSAYNYGNTDRVTLYLQK